MVSSNQGPGSWSAPLHRSRSGASHQRRGVPCQDSSLTGTLRSADGLAIGLMAVADGHGGSRYWLSDVGSRLACELAIQLASQDLAGQPLEKNGPDQLQAVYRWLAYELPERIVTAWQEAIRADWQTRQLPPEQQGETFSPQTYGTTLALVIMTPRWWAHTGLGDWDLVLLSSDQPDCIISQETMRACRERPPRAFACPVPDPVSQPAPPFIRCWENSARPVVWCCRPMGFANPVPPTPTIWL